MIAAVEAALARTQVEAVTLAVTQGLSLGAPVRGSMR
jgi:hypothetical protein